MFRLIALCTLGVSMAVAQTAMPVYVSGEILNSSSDVIVELVSQSSHVAEAKAFVRSDGHFSAGPVPPGHYQLRVATDRGEVLHSEFVEAQTFASTIQIRLNKATPERPVSGTISVKALSKAHRATMKLLASATRFREKKDNTKALAMYEKAVSDDPEFAVAHHELAVQLMTMRRPWDARRHLLRAIELDPKFETAYTNLSVADIALGDPIGAEESASRALQINSQNQKASYLKGWSLFLQGKGARPILPASLSGR